MDEQQRARLRQALKDHETAGHACYCTGCRRIRNLLEETADADVEREPALEGAD